MCSAKSPDAAVYLHFPSKTDRIQADVLHYQLSVLNYSVWQNIIGHDSVADQFRRAAERNRVNGSLLFVGPQGIGKKTFAFALAKTLLCKSFKSETFEPCGICESCRIFLSHPDFFYVCKPEDKSFIPLELLIGSKEHRGREGLCYEISRTPFMGKRKIAVIDDADFFNLEGANAMLKTLEEPPTNSLLILIGTSATKQLPTIRSRCQIVRFAPLSKRNLATILYEQKIVESLETGLKIATHADGRIETAKEIMDDKIASFRGELLRLLSSRNLDSFQLAKTVIEFVDSYGKEASLRRKCLRIVFSMVLQQDRHELHKSDAAKDAVLVRRMDRTLDALDQIDRNVNLPYLIDAWVRDMV